MIYLLIFLKPCPPLNGLNMVYDAWESSNRGKVKQSKRGKTGKEGRVVRKEHNCEEPKGPVFLRMGQRFG